jgi:hypothetical protein
MMNLHKIALVSTLFTGLLLFGVGCGEEVVEAPKPVVKKPKKKPKPKARAVSELAIEHSIDPRIYINEEEAPKDEQSRVAILQFFDAMLKVDTSELKKMLELGDQLTLDTMAQNGLVEQMDSVSFIDVKVGSSPDGRQCLMGVYEIGLDYQVQVWYFTKSGDNFTFVSAGSPPDLANTLRGNWINHFFELKDEMMEIANQPDDDSSYTIFGGSNEGDNSSSGSGRPSPGPSPSPGPRRPGGSPGGPKT